MKYELYQVDMRKANTIAFMPYDEIDPKKVWFKNYDMVNSGKKYSNEVWLESIEESNQNILIAGKSLDDPSLSLFMKALEYSPYFSNVDLNYSKQFFMDEVKIKDFEIKANVSYSAKEDDKSKLNNKEKK